MHKCSRHKCDPSRAQDESEVEYPRMVAGTPILQQYYASKYVGVSTLTFSDAGDLVSVTGKSVALGISYDADGVPSTGARSPSQESATQRPAHTVQRSSSA